MKDLIDLSDLKNRKVKFIGCEVILDEIKDKIPSNWEVVKFEKNSMKKVIICEICCRKK